MTPEQQREQLLKRILPALGVLVVYFAIISNFITEKSKKAEQQYVEMVGKGINADALPGMEQEKRRLEDEIAKLEQESKSIHAALAGESGFLSLQGSTNDAIDRITVILDDNRLQILEEIPADLSSEKSLSKSLQNTHGWLKDLLTPEEAADPKAKDPKANDPKAKKPAPAAEKKTERGYPENQDHPLCRRLSRRLPGAGDAGRQRYQGAAGIAGDESLRQGHRPTGVAVEIVAVSLYWTCVFTTPVGATSPKVPTVGSRPDQHVGATSVALGD